MKERPQPNVGAFRLLFLLLCTCFTLVGLPGLQAQHVYAANTVKAGSQQEKEAPKPLDKRISLQVKDARLADVLEKIEQQTAYVFVFSNDEIPAARKISLNVKDKRLEEVLEMICSPLAIRYELISNKIILKQGNAASTVNSQQDDVTISGRVVSDDGEGIPGANVRLQGTPTLGAVTNEQGYFTFKVPESAMDGTLICSSVGFQQSVVPISRRTSITIVLSTDSKELSEVVITAYGSQRKKQVTAAISTISTKDIESRPVSNMFQALQGTAPNLTLQQNTAEPGAALVLNIRGVGSLTGNAPLIIIDGVQAGNEGLRNLNPYDVESISVLKDAASSAIYGSQAANGVIYITTKKGKRDDKPSVQYSGMYGWQTPTTMTRQVEGWEYMTLKNEALVNSGKTPQFTPEEIVYWKNRGSEPAYVDEMLRKHTPQQNHSLSLTGGGKSASYLLSLGYVNQGNMLQNKYIPSDIDFNYKRYNARANISVDVSKYVKVDMNLAYTKSYYNKQQPDIGLLIRDAIRTPRIYPVKDSLGNFVVPALNSNNVIAQLAQQGYNKEEWDNLLGGLNIAITPVKHLTFNFNASGTYSIKNYRNRVNKYSYAPYYTTANPPVNNQMTVSEYKDMATNVYGTAEYENTFGKHYVKAQVGARSDAMNENYGFRATRYAGTNLDEEWTIGGGYIPKPDGTLDYATIGTYNDITNPNLYALNSLFGRLNYVFRDRYLAEFTWRYDGSSKLAPGHRWQFFPAFSLGWRVTDEAFLEGFRDRFGDVKFRYSWGQVGNSNIGGFNYQARVNLNPNKYPFNNTANPGADFTPYNELLEWEISTMSNYGVDAEFFKNKLSVSFDFFNKRTTGIYLTQEVPGTAGIGSSLQNVGEVENKGWELAVNYRGRTGPVSHTVGANLSDNLNRVIRFGQESIRGADYTYIIREGFPIASYFGYRADGLYQNLDDIKNAPKVPFAYNQQVQPGDIRYIDRNGDGVIDADDRYVFGNPFPRYTFGFTYNAVWKNWDFTMFWQGVGRRSQFLRGDIVEAFHNNEDHAYVQHIDRWTPTNPGASYPRLTIGTANANNFAYSDYWMFDSKYLRLKNLQLGYTLPKSVTGVVKLQSMRVYFTSQNLLTFTPKRFRELGVDPEFTQYDDKLGFANYNAIAGRNYPNAATFAFGLDIKF
ncbi:SusC/RagA family TonB-linked outer membrane protein [Chitinophaga sp. GCM10012297]|uniref:SusC/RagA family TonB-linked outer membrane protein n=1 Tax=Chitinophaga chungangae TaxID=2821488 RepID=A0ABS3YFV8_9BACT|nr:SusC/RagA family TonB-linked outer membrane protein [Chitinophaga chungangae]MBO9153568.1 SusC/RagA family TonB-linked outer membrane protein [Chitinophaga chungangae]